MPIISVKELATKISLLIRNPIEVAEKKEKLLGKRTQKNKNEGSQFARYFWKLGLETA